MHPETFPLMMSSGQPKHWAGSSKPPAVVGN